MKKWLCLLLLMLLSVNACAEYSVALVTDFGDITDQSFNQTSYEASKAFCEENGIDFAYFKPVEDSTAGRVAMIEMATEKGYNVLILPGFGFAETIPEVQGEYPDTSMIVLDLSKADVGGAITDNVFCAVYREELSGYMAGYAAVKLGYTHLGFLGGAAMPAVVRYGYGFVQGVNDAAVETGADVTLEYVYGNQFYGDADITAYMDTWYQTLGVQCVFSCGGGIYTSVAEAAAKVSGAKLIGVDVDMAPIIDKNYGEGLVLTSAMKGLAETVRMLLGETINGNFAKYGGREEALGIVSEDPSMNYLQLSPSTQWGEGFTEEDYRTLVSRLYHGEIKVSDAVDVPPETSITVNYLGTVK